MKTVQLGAPRPTSAKNKYRIDLPPAFGPGGYDVDVFGSGLKLIVMQTVWQQMLSCPYGEKAGSLYLESKAMEWLSHKLEQLPEVPMTML